MLDIDDLVMELGHFRLLEADNALFIPIRTNIRLLVTSEDVIHS
jgi:heme/copper-type cytochrome/quinol oxidase subunit 2